MRGYLPVEEDGEMNNRTALEAQVRERPMSGNRVVNSTPTIQGRVIASWPPGCFVLAVAVDQWLDPR